MSKSLTFTSFFGYTSTTDELCASSLLRIFGFASLHGVMQKTRDRFSRVAEDHGLAKPKMQKAEKKKQRSEEVKKQKSNILNEEKKV
jgi:hypothetical protein